VIKIESVHIEEMRGIRKLDLAPNQKTFAISGPNGSGKSGVIDAIEFGLTGQIGRLSGRGTQGITVSEHGPHVDKTKFPDAALVTLRVRLTGIGKTATITRKVANPNKPRIEPADADVKAVLAEVADHPEITLSRREILRFILVEPTKRSEEIQTILKLEDIGQTRAILNTAQNKLQTAYKTASAQVESTRSALMLHLQVSTFRAEDVLGAVNQRRTLLGLSTIPALTADTQLDASLSAAPKPSEFNKESALRDLKALAEAAKGFADLGKKEAEAITADMARLDADPALLAALQRRSFVEKGLELVDGVECPLCDTAWKSERQLREHLTSKLAKSEKARKLQAQLLENGGALIENSVKVSGLIGPVQKLAESGSDSAIGQMLSAWRTDLDALRTNLQTIDGIREQKKRIAAGWVAVPKGLPKALKTLTESVEARPDQTASIDAQTFLTTAQTRLSDYREAMRKSKAAEIAADAAKQAYSIYCDVLEEELNALYDEVQKDFSAFYRAINGEDEATFTAKLTPSEGSLGLEVNFYERGLFPPVAYHSEGHQDGMGVCLYLALMKRLFGDQFTFALLDDVVMSVDAGHRYEFCKLLKTQFPDTQFVITTHDRLWAEQMRSAGLVTAKTSVAFHSWTVDSGPLVESNLEIWAEIVAALAKGKVEVAAAALRHHLEYVSRHIADQIGATPTYRADGNYELGELMPAVLKRMKEICGKAIDAAQSWGDATAKEEASNRKAMLSTSSGATNVEQWAVNKAVHYNVWGNFGKNDFEPVVAAFKELLGCFSCDKCESWLYVTPRTNPDSLRCACNAVNLNLKSKPK
jgi:RecF/RecN/SMC N terminal domain